MTNIKNSLKISLLLIFTAFFLVGCGAENDDLREAISVADQDLTNSELSLISVSAPYDFWIVIHDMSSGKPTAGLGKKLFKAGTYSNVKIPVKISGSQKVSAMMHFDKGEVGTFEFPGADVPTKITGKVLNIPFQVTVN